MSRLLCVVYSLLLAIGKLVSSVGTKRTRNNVESQRNGTI